MKKIICVILCLIFALSLGACTGGGNDADEGLTTAKRDVVITRDELAKYADAGRMKDVEFELGYSHEKLIDFYEKVRNTTVPEGFTGEQAGKFYDYRVGNRLTSLSYDNMQYFFINDNLSAGIAVMTNNSEAFGFSAGNCFSDDIIHSLGTPDVTDYPNSEQLFYMFGTPDNASRLTYFFKNNVRLDFIMINDLLCMTVLSDTEIYEGFYEVEQTQPVSTAENDEDSE